MGFYLEFLKNKTIDIFSFVKTSTLTVSKRCSDVCLQCLRTNSHDDEEKHTEGIILTEPAAFTIEQTVMPPPVPDSLFKNNQVNGTSESFSDQIKSHHLVIKIEEENREGSNDMDFEHVDPVQTDDVVVIE